MSSLAPFVRVSSALLIRELSTRFGSRPGGYAWTLIEPAGYILMMSLVFQAIAHLPALGSSFILFFATGYISFSFYKQTEAYVGSAISANKTLLQYPKMAPIDAIVARFVLQIYTNALVSITILGAICWFALSDLPTVDWGKLTASLLLASVLGLVEAMINATLKSKYKLYDKIYSIITRPMFLLSGVFFLPDKMPHPYNEYLLYNPVCHVIMLFRQGFYPEYRASGLSIDYLTSFAFTLLFIGLGIFTLFGRTFKDR